MLRKYMACSMFLLIREMVGEDTEMELAWEEYRKC
jgi:hypothetical protein